ncbi:hypothetical protein RR46_11760 [Papilio xuthus]|uniref:Uncharacterized protein n=1 Tax=Papilio xuthus TaxID=66420 RepID=A0A194PMU7_PAPXU|nr:hypothetical protein RR46_11760 [Papilio xuthus]
MKTIIVTGDRSGLRATVASCVRSGMRAMTNVCDRSGLRATVASDVRSGVRAMTNVCDRSGLRATVASDVRSGVRAMTNVCDRSGLRATVASDVRSGVRAMTNVGDRSGLRATVASDVRSAGIKRHQGCCIKQQQELKKNPGSSRDFHGSIVWMLIIGVSWVETLRPYGKSTPEPLLDWRLAHDKL